MHFLRKKNYTFLGKILAAIYYWTINTRNKKKTWRDVLSLQFKWKFLIYVIGENRKFRDEKNIFIAINESFSPLRHLWKITFISMMPWNKGFVFDRKFSYEWELCCLHSSSLRRCSQSLFIRLIIQSGDSLWYTSLKHMTDGQRNHWTGWPANPQTVGHWEKWSSAQ